MSTTWILTCSPAKPAAPREHLLDEDERIPAAATERLRAAAAVPVGS